MKKRNTKSMEEIKAIVTRLEAVVQELRDIGCYGGIQIGTTSDDNRIELLMSNEDLPEGKASYEKFEVPGAFRVQKNVMVGSVEFHTYLTKTEAQQELFGA